jgi:hypothetical protein
MNRISIDVTPEQHQRLKALAALQGKTIKDFVLECTLGGEQADSALRELEVLLDQRIQKNREGGRSPRTVADIFREARERERPR